jgi:hypothetical protein
MLNRLLRYGQGHGGLAHRYVRFERQLSLGIGFDKESAALCMRDCPYDAFEYELQQRFKPRLFTEA